MPNDNEFVFKEGSKGLEFVGDFEGLYKAEQDPWGQSGDTPALSLYYATARINLISSLRKRLYRNPLGVEIGCGHGHVVGALASIFGGHWTGIDVSPTAVAKARELYPQSRFTTHDITQPYAMASEISVSVVILGQVLWYVLHKFPQVIENCHNMLAPDGLLVISQAYLTSPQRYGQELADGFEGTVRLILNEYRSWFRLVEARCDDRLGLTHHDGLLVFRKV